MGFVKKLGMAVVILLLLGGLAFYFGRGIEKSSLEKFEITGIKNIDQNSFTLNAALFVKNPSKLTVPVHNVTYDVILHDNNQVISSGEIPAFQLAAGEVSSIPLSQEVRWVPTATLAARLVTQEHVYADVKGKLYIGLPGADQYAIPFEKEADIKAYVQQFATAKFDDPTPKTLPLP